MSEAGPIITYCIEHAKTQQSVCAACDKTIPHKSLRVAEIYRKNRKVKKDQAKHTWYHFKCWKVPELLVRVPIEQFRGYPALNDKDKARVQRVIESGVGSSWGELMEKSKPVKTEKELEEEQEKKEKKDKKKQEGEETLNMDLTDKLTGVQETKKKDNTKKKQDNKKKVDNKSKAIKKDNSKKANNKNKELVSELKKMISSSKSRE